MNISLADWANVATIVLAVAAIVAGILAWWNIRIFKEQRRLDTFLKLLDWLTSQRERDNRGEIHSLWEGREMLEGLYNEPDLGQRTASLIDHARYLQKQRETNRIIESIIR